MSSLSQIQLQQNVKNSAEDLQKTLKDLYQWENDIKAKEKQSMKQQHNENVNIPTIRSHIDSESEKIKKESSEVEKIMLNEKSKNVAKSLEKIIIEAGHFKEAGNKKVKEGQYEDAIALYSEAIKINNTDAVFYTNRALCFLKLERFDECINDCNTAIQMDPSLVKAYYRRMQANESLGLAHKAFEDCNKLLEIDPNNLDGKKSFNRIHQRIKRYDKTVTSFNKEESKTLNVPKSKFTAASESLKIIPVRNKPAHLRSKKPLKRVLIDEVIEAKSTSDAANIQISDEVIDKLFNNSDCGSYVEVKKSAKKAEMAVNEKVEENISTSVERSVHLKVDTAEETFVNSAKKSLPKTPTSTAQFHANWKELSDEQKYLYFKSIETCNINKILGAGLDSETLSEIIKIIEDFYIRDKVKVAPVLMELARHSEISILNLFLSQDDRKALNNIQHYLEDNEKEFEKMEFIRKRFNI